MADKNPTDATKLKELELAKRDGTSQAARRRQALDPGYVAVDERRAEDLLVLAKDYGARLRYYGEDDRPGGDWSGFIAPRLADVVAFLKEPERFNPEKDPLLFRPHFVLFLAFLKMFGKAQGELNKLTRRHLDFYYRQVLGLATKPAVPDRVNLLFDLARGVDEALVPAGSLLSAGPDSLGKDRLYATDRDLVVNRAQVAKLSSIHVEKRTAGIADVRGLHPNDKKKAARKMLEIALGDPRPGDPLPSYPLPGHEGDRAVDRAVDLDFLKTLRGLFRFLDDGLWLALFELRSLIALKRRRDAADPEWEIVNGYPELAGRTRLDSFDLSFGASRDFDANLEKAIGGPPNFGRLPDVDSLSDAYEQRGREDVQEFVRDQLFFTRAASFDAMMRVKVKIDGEWREIRRLLQGAGQRKRQDPDFRLPTGSSDFDLLLKQAVDLAANALPILTDLGASENRGTIEQYGAEIDRLESYFFVPADELAYFVDVADKGAAASADEWRRSDEILEKAHREKVYATRSDELKAIHQEDGIDAMLCHALGQAPETCDRATALADLGSYLAAESHKFVQGVATAAEVETPGEEMPDWPRVYSVLEIAERNREDFTPPLAQSVEWRNLYPAGDATAVLSEVVREGELPRWKTFGDVTSASPDAPPPAALGWALASPILALAEGRRTIDLTLGFRSETFAAARGLSDFLKREKPLSLEVSTEKGWVAVRSSAVTPGVYAALSDLPGSPHQDLAAIRLTLELTTDVDPVAAFPEDADGIALSVPALRLRLRQLWNESDQSYRTLYGELRDLRWVAVHVEVKVEGLASLRLQNDDTTLDATRPFEPFGAAPAAGARLLLGHPEIVTKRIDKLDFDLEWMGVPADLTQHYANYGFKAGEPSFSTRVSLVDRRVDSVLRQKAPLCVDGKLAATEATAPAPLYGRAPVAVAGDDLLSWDRYLRWELNTPDFQHQTYPGVASGKAIEMAAAIGGRTDGVTLDPASYQVHPPYTPKLKSLKVDYTSSLEIAGGAAETSADDRVLHVHPFGHALATDGATDGDTDSDIPFLPTYDDEGELYVGLSDVQAPQSVAVLFQLAEGSADPDIEPAEVAWSHLDGDSWKSLDDGKVLFDTTRGLVNSGIVLFDLDAVSPSTLLPGGCHWLRASVGKGSAALCDTIAIHTQAVAAGGAPKQHFEEPLPAETLAQLATPRPEIAGVRQPYTSQGGRPAEDESSFAIRVSERLRHKRRALTVWDYERLVLEHFPEVYKAKCIPASHGGSFGSDPLGQVVLVVIPDIRKKLPFDPFAPKVPADLLASIREMLAEVTPAAAAVRVKNAHYVAVKVRFSVRFSAVGNDGYYKTRLGDELNRFLSPWAYDDGADIVVGGRIYANSIVDFLDRRPYVDYVADLKLFVSDDKKNFRLVRTGGVGGYAASAERDDAVLVAARQHEIDLIPESGYVEDLATGINFMRLELDFIVA